MKPTTLPSSIALAASRLAGVAADHEHGAHPSAASFGHRADAAKATRSIAIDMSDQLRFTPDRWAMRFQWSISSGANAN